MLLRLAGIPQLPGVEGRRVTPAVSSGRAEYIGGPLDGNTTSATQPVLLITAPLVGMYPSVIAAPTAQRILGTFRYVRTPGGDYVFDGQEAA